MVAGLTATLFNPNEPVTIVVGGVQLASTTADGTGTVIATITIPQPLAPGVVLVSVNATDRPLAAQTNFTVLTASVALDNSSAGPGSNINVSGGGYYVGEIVDVSFNGTNLAQAVADNSGNIATSFNVPAATAGTYAVAATGETSSNVSSTPFIIPSPAVQLDTTSGAPGVTVTSAGTGYEANETVNVSFNGAVVSTGSADSLGNFSVQFQVPQATSGDYPVQAAGAVSNATATATFTVVGQ